VEAFSDGVFAIAITFLILEIRVPHLAEDTTNGHLLSAMIALWPSFLAYALSFFVILIMCIRKAYRVGLVVYAAAVGVALWNAAAGLVLGTSLWLVWTRLGYASESRGA